MSIIGRSYALPTGQQVVERINTRTGDVTYDLTGSDGMLYALDAMELGRLAEKALRGLTLPPMAGYREYKIGQTGGSFSVTGGQVSTDRSADSGPLPPEPNKTGGSNVLQTMNYGPCVYGCGRAVTEADEWGQLDDAYPPAKPYHVDCRLLRRLPPLPDGCR